MITKETIIKSWPYTTMRGVEDNMKIVSNYLKAQPSRKAHVMAEKIDFCLYCLQVQYPDTFPEPAPDVFETPLFDEDERKDDEAFEKWQAARAARKARRSKEDVRA